MAMRIIEGSIMKARKNVCVVVDAYSTGSVLAGIFSTYGYPTIHVQSSDFIPNIIKKTFRPSDFTEHFLFDGNIASLCQTLKNYTVKCVVAGCESGVELADLLSEKLGILTNGTEYSQARRNKYVMREALHTAHVPCVNHFKSSDIDKILEWARSNNFKEPLVLKPIASSSTDGFHICYNEEDVRNAFKKIHLSMDIFGKVNEEVLVQNYLDGQEYCVNMVSYEGKHYLSEIWRVNKILNGHSKIYDLEYLVTPEDDEFELLHKYTEKVLDALHIKYGPSHSEIIITKQGQPTLVESAARLMGSLDLSLVSGIQGTNAPLLTAEAYLAPDLFLKRFNEPRPKMKKIAYMVQLVSRQEGILEKYSIENLSNLKTFHGVDTYLEPGSSMKITVDTQTSPGRVFLMSDNKEDLEQDYATIRDMEKNGKVYSVMSIKNNSHIFNMNRNEPPHVTQSPSVETTEASSSQYQQVL